MRWVTISHPKAGTARVAASSVPFHTASGWVVIPDPPPVLHPVDDPGDPAGGEATPSEPAKARRANKKEND
jgi:hypothetical protein